ncbi:MAG: DNA alkylation repair protein [Amylibacter sp.]|jgi:3-methyladenine DNA glycosylase AlkD|tara:strand:- start:30909 stop:31586 length:678 start_codon:yes stop_codon:yes gene_type:complete
MITFSQALEQLHALTDPKIAAQMQNSYKIDRLYLGVSNLDIDTLYKQWRIEVDGDARISLASELWYSNIHEARIAAAKLLTQARISSDDNVWQEITRWIPTLDHAVIADQVCGAGARRLKSTPERLDQVATWVQDENIWVRRSTLTLTMPWTKMNNPKAEDFDQRDQVLSWAGELASDTEWLIQKAIATWLSSLSKHDAPRVLSFLEKYGTKMKPFAINESCKFL